MNMFVVAVGQGEEAGLKVPCFDSFDSFDRWLFSSLNGLKGGIIVVV